MSLLLVAFSILVLFIITLIFLKCRRPSNFPPGPPALPIVGSSLLVGSRPAVRMHEWKEKYGDIFGWYNGRQRVVVISDFHVLKKLFSEDAASGRIIRRLVRTESTLPLNIGLVGSEGELWKIHRRFALSTLRDLGMGKNWLEDVIIGEVESMCAIFRAQKGAPINPSVLVTNTISNVICAMIFGKRFELTDPKFSRITSLISANLAVHKLDFLAQTFPFLMWFPNYVSKKIAMARQNVKDLRAFMSEMIREHDASPDPNAECPDYLFAYRRERAQTTNPDVKETFTEMQLIGSLFDLFAAGSEATTTTLLWAMVHLIENPDVMRTAQAEIDERVGKQKVITSSDRVLLPYIEGVIMEAQRCGNTSPLGVPHRSLEEIKVGGYTIPENTILVANTASIHYDTRYWKDPQRFDPSRYLKDGALLVRPEALLPLGVGKRLCLAEPLVRMELFLFIANLLRCFTLELPEGKTLSSNDYVSSLVNCPNPFELIFTPRF
ncbi:Cytochrome P450 18a1 [Hypsibius exemplaris]|uniref:Cytochrome P450 18a1 n=1 Tax=Hypsibius exemplaris TaxID=2072580 RepID=A0A1W0X4Z5_HYPEX|nr:Cytochrome P450 18a1 [Hypsibius exemplaris]